MFVPAVGVAPQLLPLGAFAGVCHLYLSRSRRVKATYPDLAAADSHSRSDTRDTLNIGLSVAVAIFLMIVSSVRPVIREFQVLETNNTTGATRISAPHKETVWDFPRVGDTVNWRFLLFQANGIIVVSIVLGVCGRRLAQRDSVASENGSSVNAETPRISPVAIPKHLAQFLLEHATHATDYAAALREVRKLGLA